jgi:tetratricopeptide (TPR) repeat protein
MDQNKDTLGWLIRDTTNVIRGPFRHQEVLQLIKKGQLKGKTEIARANAYWFSLDEKAELGKFFPELGIATPSQDVQTQMTATLTHAEPEDPGVDVTQFTNAPVREALAKEAGAADGDTSGMSRDSDIEWLSNEMAEEFGEYNQVPETYFEPSEPTAATETDISDDPRKRATVKADTLPSELKDFQGSRPKPINTLLRGPAAGTNTSAPSSTVHVPVNVPDPHVLIIPDREQAGSTGKSKFIVTAVSALGLIALIAVYLGTKKPASKITHTSAGNRAKSLLSPEQEVKRALLLFDLDRAKDAMIQADGDPQLKTEPPIMIAQAMIKKEFLYDSEAAASQLQSLRPNLQDSGLRAEVDNLIGLYIFDRDPPASMETFRKLLTADPANSIARYNLVAAMLRAGNSAGALQIALPFVSSLRDNDPLMADAAILLGWAQEAEAKGGDASAEASFIRAIKADPSSSAARLGLAIHRLRKNGFRASEADFRAFVDSMPELDPPSRVKNFRLMTNFDFYNFARGRIRELNLDGPMGSKPSPLIMAVDAMLSCIQNRTAEAGKILEGALSTAPGDSNVMKAVGYHRWKEGRYPEILDLFRDIPKERYGFAVPMILGKAYMKLENWPHAKKMFEQTVATSPQRSEGWSLLGEMLLTEGKEAEAKIKFNSALAKDPRDLVALRGLDHIGVQSIYNPDLMENLPF